MFSIIVPIYNEQDVIPQLLERIKNAAADWGDYEVIFVDDGSHDRSVELLKEAMSSNKRMRLIVFSRNFGHQAAVSAGLMHAEGDCVAVIDGDLQDPPEILQDFIKKWKEGYEVVYGVRKTRKENILKRACYSLFYKLLRSMALIDIPLDAGDFCVMDRRVVDVINQMPERNRFIRGLRSYAGFRSCGVPYERKERFAGEPKYTLRKLSRLALDGITGFSTVPLKIAVYVGFVIAFLSFLAGVFLVILKSAYEVKVQGWTSLIVVVFFMGGVQLFIIGVLGEYIGRIYSEVQGRPVYIIKNKCGFEGN